ncbi:glycoside hydrolase family 130 protein [Paremcibacter congregatus]|uniref:Glycosidase n=1 Tax=Paremcibacter congregatus TaxID=2043170 RepID=A0A2G4YS01_9PROT|nr:glycoside hydrolase family 130 protein [Paremcibacter congregatus]PHZ85095.1 glycosidase [Paremcibacter congregatus]QDE27955.1 glycosidase [Paremcibacter congregatus]
MLIKRSEFNPLITPAMVKPSKAGFKVDGTFNAGVIDYNGETVMLLRVAESVITSDNNEIRIPFLTEVAGACEMTIKSFRRDDETYDFSDPRMIALKANPKKGYLTSLSHIRLARSQDGVNFVVEDEAFIFPDNRYELFGCEDPRVTQIEGVYYINYSSVSGLGITTSLARTSNFRDVEKLGLIFAPDNRDVCLFPEKIQGYYWALHRPAPMHLGTPEIWISKSPDLLHWGDHTVLAECSDSEWDKLKIGGGAPMLKTSKGWLQIYHGVDETQRYCMGAFLTDIDDPTKVIARMNGPLVEPWAPYETDGFFGNVVFSCGALIKNEVLHIYYGAADEVMALATISLDALWGHLFPKGL